jgi:MinD-like ATPase involved in chromosome partitioning or flagellar assembly
MIIVWSIKGGSGTTVTACSLALRSPSPATIVDLAGDVPAVLGLPEPPGPGVGDWLHSPTADADDLVLLAVPTRDGLSVVHTGSPPPPHAPWERLAAALGAHHDPRLGEVVVDAGLGEPPAALARAATQSLLVTRSCYVSLRHGVRLAHRPTGIVLITEPGRSLAASSIEHAIGAPVVAQVPWDPAVARAVDSGMLGSRLPRSITSSLRRVA